MSPSFAQIVKRVSTNAIFCGELGRSSDVEEKEQEVRYGEDLF
jgi:hypothetical protein